MLPVPSSAERPEIETAIDYFLFGSGRPFSLLDDPFFRNMVHALRPGFKLAHSNHFRDVVLKRIHLELKAKVETRLSRSKALTLCADDSEDARNIGLTNVIALSPTPYLIGSLPKNEVKRGGADAQVKKLLPMSWLRERALQSPSSATQKTKCKQLKDNES